MPPEQPYDWAQEFNEREDERVEELLPPSPADWAKIDSEPDAHALSWLRGDQEYYPIWSTTLYEQDQIWRTKFNLRTSEQRIERLAQEAALYVLLQS